MISRRALVFALVTAFALGGVQPLWAATPSFQNALSLGIFGQLYRAPSPFATSNPISSGLRRTRLFDGEAGTRFLRGTPAAPLRVEQLAFGFAAPAPMLGVALSQRFALAQIAPISALRLPNVAVPDVLGGRLHLYAPAESESSAYVIGARNSSKEQNQGDLFDLNSSLSQEAPITVSLPLHNARINLRMLGYSSNDVASGAQSLNVGSSFAVQTARTRVRLDLQSNYQRITAITPQSITTLPLNNPSLLSPSAVDFQQQSVGATLALPLKRGFSVGVGYGQTHLFGSYIGSAPFDLNAHNNTYLGNLTYRLPHSESAITLSAKRTYYQDNLLPTLSLPQTNNDVNLTIKF